MSKRAVISSLPLTVNVQEPVPLHPPPIQPLNVEPLSATAESATDVSPLNDSMQLQPGALLKPPEWAVMQSMPVPVTLPDPVPDMRTRRFLGSGRTVTVTSRVLESSPSFAERRTTYVPQSENVAVVTGIEGRENDTRPGADTTLHEVETVEPMGKLSSVTMYVNEAMFGRVTVIC